MKNITEITTFLKKVLGKNSAECFHECLDEMTYYVRLEALYDLKVSEKQMRYRIRKMSEGIIADSIKTFLNENYSDSFGEVELCINDDGVYDKNINPIPALDKMHATQKEITHLMVMRTMAEFTKGRSLARVVSKEEPEVKPKAQKPARKEFSLEQVEIEIMRLEKKLPNLTPQEAKILSAMYKIIKG